MSNSYAPGTPLGNKGEIKIGYPPAKAALASSTHETAGVSSILLLGHNTTEIHVAVVGSVNGALGSGAAGKWLTQAIVDSSVAGTSVLTGVATANFDFIVPAGTVRTFVVPQATNVANNGSIMGVNRSEGLYPAVAFKLLAGSGSVLTMQF